MACCTPRTRTCTVLSGLPASEAIRPSPSEHGERARLAELTGPEGQIPHGVSTPPTRLSPTNCHGAYWRTARVGEVAPRPSPGR